MTLLLILNMVSYSSNRPINIGKLRELICEDETSCSIDWIWIAQDNPLIIVRAKVKGPSWPGTFKTWLVDYSESKYRHSPDKYEKNQLLVLDDHCANDWCGHDIFIDVNENMFKITEDPGRGCVDQFFELQLRPLRILSEGDGLDQPAGGPEVYPPFYQFNWDWINFRGKGENILHHNIYHKDAGEYLFYAIPYVPFDSIKSSWEKITLGNCSLHIGSSETPGFTLYGDSTGPEFKVLVISDNELLVEIFEAEFFKGETNWLTSDHLEIWQRTSITKPVSNRSGESTDYYLYQWGIRLFDGKVFPAQNDPKELPEVRINCDKERQIKHGSTILKIKLPYPIERVSSLSVSYSKSENGKKVKSLISTSQLIFDNCYTLSLVNKIDPDIATCVLSNDTLTFKDTYVFKPYLPIIDLVNRDKIGILPSRSR